MESVTGLTIDDTFLAIRRRHVPAMDRRGDEDPQTGAET